MTTECVTQISGPLSMQLLFLGEGKFPGLREVDYIRLAFTKLDFNDTADAYLCQIKEMVKRRQRESIEFLSLLKMGLLGSQASTVNFEQLLRAVFYVFMFQNYP